MDNIRNKDKLEIESFLNEVIKENKEMIQIIRKKAKKEVFDEIKKIMEQDYKGSWLETIEKNHKFQKDRTKSIESAKPNEQTKNKRN